MAAAEYVLRLLPAEEHSVLHARVATDAEFASLVAKWERWLHPLAEEAPPAEPSAELWRRIAARLRADEASAANENPAGASGGRLRLWQAWGTLMTVTSAVLAALIIARPEAGPADPAPVVEVRAPVLSTATLRPEAGEPVAVITYDAVGERLLISPVKVDAGSGQTPQLWLLPDDGGPVSLGIFDAGTGAEVILSPLPDAGSTLAISIEPAGGSPTGQPTGPVIGQGSLSRL